MLGSIEFEIELYTWPPLGIAHSFNALHVVGPPVRLHIFQTNKKTRKHGNKMYKV